MKRTNLTAFLALVLALGFAAEARSEIKTPAGLKPGDKFRIVFVTSTTRDATSSKIEDYDAFVTERAKAGGLDTYAEKPVTWSVIGSTPTVSVKSRLPDTSPAVYLPTGLKVADSGKFWSGGLGGVPINVDETGKAVPSQTPPARAGDDPVDTLVWTGVGGEVWNNNNTNVRLGETSGGKKWSTLGKMAGLSRMSQFTIWTGPSSSSHRFYGVSDVLTVPAGK